MQIRIIRNYINQINSQMQNRTNAKQFKIVRFEPNNILLYHKNTKKTYQYLQSWPSAPLHPHISHPSLLRPIIYNNGLLYPRGLSNIETEMQNRRRGHKVIYFEQQEILNTFTPLMECLMFLHKNGVVHGGISPHNIIVTDDQEIKLKDWMIDHIDNAYYSCKQRKEITQEDDLMALGQIIAEAATLRKGFKLFQEKDLTHVLETLVDRYSKGFVFGVAILLKRNKQRFGHLLGYFRNEQKYVGDLELNSLYSSLKKEQEKKKQAGVTNQNAAPNKTLSFKQICSLTQSPVKKSTPNSSLTSTTKRVKQDENKKMLHEQTKKKQIQKINKIIQRSNQFVNQLMARKNNEQILKKIAPKPNVAANISMYEPKKIAKETPPLQISPAKRIRASSKKK